MICNAVPYEGKEKYAFISYCHEDAWRVYPIVEQMAQSGCRVWYDRGIEAGADWPDVIAQHLLNSEVCIVFLSPAYANSNNCRQEQTYAIIHQKNLLCIRLQETPLSAGMEMQLSRTQHINWTRDAGNGFYGSVLSAKALKDCIGTPDPSVLVQPIKEPEEKIEEFVEKDEVLPPVQPHNDKLEADEDEKLQKQREELERLRQEEERKQREEEERKQREEEERKRREEEERKRREEEERKRREEEERKQREEEERKQREEEERKRREEEERKRREEEQRRKKEEAELSEKKDQPSEKNEPHSAVPHRDAFDTPTVIETPSYKKESVSGATEIPQMDTRVLLVDFKTGAFDVFQEIETLIGRENSNYAIDEVEKRVGRQHCRIVWYKDQYFVQDMKSANGTWLDGTKLETQENGEGRMTELPPVSLLSLAGKDGLRLIVAVGEKAQHIEQEGEISLLLSKEYGGAFFLGEDGAELGRGYPWPCGAMKDERISREHADIILRDGVWTLIDHSTNHCYLDGVRVADSEAKLVDGMSIRLGGEHLLFRTIRLQEGGQPEEGPAMSTDEHIAHRRRRSD